MTPRTALGAVCLGLVAACAPEAVEQAAGTPPRVGRFGSLRDFVLIERAEDGRIVAVFVDRFEATRGDWAQFAASPAGRSVEAAEVPVTGNATLPVAGVDLRQARAFAAWRFARLPRRVEWEAAVGDGRHPYPWGSREDWTRANAGELGLGQPTPVGTFESGRVGLDQPYDLIGNVSEWTETVAAHRPADAVPLDLGRLWGPARRRALAAPALAVWQGPGGLIPLGPLVSAAGDELCREVVGADFQTSMTEQIEAVPAGDRRSRTGFRICASPRELLHALVQPGVEASATDLEQVRRFVRRGGHRAVLSSAWPEFATAPGPVADLLRAELGS